MRVYREAISFARDVSGQGCAPVHRIQRFRRETAAAKFLFGGDRAVLRVLDDMYKAAVEVDVLNRKLGPPAGLPVGPERSEAVQRQEELFRQFACEFPRRLDTAMAPYLRLP